ncbi:MAG: PEGA domain-containing protein [Actinobacteria bacterium]|nr:PEGA domain-containing protein [Actinomycetota bacterium]
MKKQLTVYLTISLVFISIILITSCATILHGTDQEISISSSPDGALVIIKTFGGVKVIEGTTPLKATLKREDEYKVSVIKEGYEDNEIIIKNSTSAAVWGNILCGGIIGLIIDFSNGAAYELEPETIHVDLIKVVGMNNKTEYYLLFKMLDDNGSVQTIVRPFEMKKNI